MGDYSHLVGKDELGMAHLLADYQVEPLTEAQVRYLVNLTKYEVASDEYRECRVKVDADLDIVAVLDPATGRYATIMRNFVEQVPLDGGRKFNVYEVVGFRMFGRGVPQRDEVLQHIQDIRSQTEFVVARSIFGFGDGGEALQEALDEPSANPFLDDED